MACAGARVLLTASGGLSSLLPLGCRYGAFLSVTPHGSGRRRTGERARRVDCSLQSGPPGPASAPPQDRAEDESGS